jgi:hypothetical protein
MKRAMWAACLWLAGCAGSGGYCDHVLDYVEDCETATYTGDLQTCEESLAACSAEDEEALISFFDCLVAIAPCGATTSSTTGLEGLACFEELDSVSAECLGATTTYPYTTTLL